MSSAASTLDAFIDRVGGIATPFSIALPDGAKRNVGDGAPSFHVDLHNDRAMKALRTLEEGDIAEAYLQGDIDIERKQTGHGCSTGYRTSQGYPILCQLFLIDMRGKAPATGFIDSG